MRKPRTELGRRARRLRKVEGFVPEPLPQLFTDPELEPVPLAKADLTAASAQQLLDLAGGRLKPRERKTLFAVAHRLPMPKDAIDISKVVEKLATRTKHGV